MQEFNTKTGSESHACSRVHWCITQRILLHLCIVEISAHAIAFCLY